MKSELEKRKVYIDVAKGIAILLVILGHMNRFFSYDGHLNQIVYSVQLPVFLLIGGYWIRLREGESPGRFFQKKFYRLIQPYFLFAFASILYAWPEDAAKFCFYVSGTLWGIGVHDYLPNLPIWFLPMFFVANCGFYLALLVGSLGKKNWQKLALEAAAVGVMMAAGWKLKLRGERLPWGFELALILQGMFFAGHIWRLLEEHFFLEGSVSKKQAVMLAVLAVPAFFVWAVCVRRNGRVDINAAWFGKAGLWSFYLAAFAGCYLLFLTSAVLSRFRPAAWLFSLFGKNSMTIMAVHVPTLIWMDGVITPLMPQIIKANFMQKNWIGVGYSFVTTALLSLFAAMLLKRPGNVQNGHSA